jgi:DNA (cytosine-5)-methyltransferase 1
MKLKITDLFCGAGGTSTGIIRAAHKRGCTADLLAVNHWPTAVRTHELNHPSVRHLCENLDSVDPRKEVDGNLDLLAGSPECTHHSNARGGVPCSDQSRATAWHMLRWMDAKQPKGVMLENVREFKDWAPLGSNGRPLKSKKGELFQNFIRSMNALGYHTDWRILNAADYGDATSRQRLILMAVKRGKVVWPDPTHQPSAFGKYKKHRAAKEIIDWNIPGKSIYDRKKPLAPNTMKRIMAGLKKFGGESFIISMEHGGRLFDPSKPMPTLTTADGFGVCQPFLLGQQSGAAPRSVNDPVPTIATAGAISLVQPFLVKLYGTGKVSDIDKPCPTVTAGGNHLGLAEPFLVKYYGTGGASSVDEPLDTITTKDRFLLVMPDGSKARLDIRFRMLQPHELSAAMGFPADYEFSGTREERVKQIGNAVPVNLAEAVATSLMNVTLN